ncbi:amidase [Draconibacterium halophilum]|uniref:Amidase n=1 Tax=Draconibacterium halophilum TaxID=2706887 RepID=A0A6C0RA19_9BACT|nr:amidase [Draconibacterium halophilum]QIA06273.1 amidase [Draconibacterium halophilum]
MKRRSFFKTTALGGSVLALSGVTACVQESKVPEEVDLTAFDLNETSALELQQKMESRELTAESICKKYLDRIALVDPHLKSVIELNPDAMDIAKKLDEERQNGKVRGPLHGIPVMIKDNIDTGDKMQTTAGSLALVGNVAEKDAFIVKKLRDAGAVLLGKTNLSEWANFRSTNSSSGWSGRGGQVRNPFCLDRSPCGSSSGTGAAVSGNLCTIGIGTETNGSIVCPSGINGVVGIKPTLGTWSRQGIIPIAHSQDTAGPMARNVTDAAILLGALAEFDASDAKTHLEQEKIYNDYTSFLKLEGLQGKRIGIASQMIPSHEKVKELIKNAVQAMQQNEAELVEDLEFETNRKWGEPSYQVLLYEFKADLNKYLQEHPSAPRKSLKELIEFNKTNADKEMPWFGQEIFEEAQEKGDLNSEEYLKALDDSKRFAGKEGIDALMDEHNLDALIAPTNGPTWSIDWVNGDSFTGGSSSPAAISGYPNITVPMGFVEGLPIGLSFFGRAWSEPVLLEIAYAFEQATKHRESPDFKKSLME